MKKTQFTELFANIRATLVSFLSIVLFVALGVGLYSGLCWSAKGIYDASDNAYKAGNFHDVEVTFPYGITADDIAAVKSLDGVSDCDPGYISYQRFDLGKGNKNAAVRSVSSSVDVLTVNEGSLPSGPGQIAVDSLSARANDIHIGDVISFTHDAEKTSTGAKDSDGMKYLTCDSYTVTALVTSPAYLSQDSSSYGSTTTGGAVNSLMFIDESNFDFNELGGYYNTLLVTSDELADLSVYSEQYKTKAAELVQRISDESSARAQERFDGFIAAKQAQVDEARARLKAAGVKASDGKKKIVAAQKTIDEKTRNVEDAQLELDVTLKLLNSQEKMTKKQLAQVESQIETFDQRYKEARANVDERVSKVDDLVAEKKGVHAYSKEVSNAYSELASTHADIEKRYAAGQISSPERTAENSVACKTFASSIAASEKNLKKNSPTVYKRCGDSVGNITKAAKALQYVDSENLSSVIMASSNMVAQAKTLETAYDSMMKEAKDAAKSATTQMNTFKTSLENVKKSYKRQSDQLKAKIAAGRQKVDAGQAQVDDGKKKLAAAQKKVNDKTQVLLDAQAQLEDGKRQLDEAQSKIDNTTAMSWILMPANYNGGVVTTKSITDMLRNLRGSMASLFVIVGLLVCYSAISRIVHEQITQLGTKKALGFTNGEVTLFYLAYSATAVVLGALIGIGVAMLVVEPILLPSLNQTVLPTPAPAFGFSDFATISVIELVLILLSTYIACRGVLRRSAIELLQGEKPPQNKQRFYEKWNIWNRLPLLTQTIVNNCINDRRRIVSTLIGVAGCTALIVSAVALKDNISTSFSIQENEICTYDIAVTASSASDDEKSGYTVEDLLDDKGLVHAKVMRSSLALTCPDNEQLVASLYVPQNEEEFSQVFHLRSLGAGDGAGVLDGVWVSYAYANAFKAKVGDKLNLKNSLGQQFEIPIAGFFAYHSFGMPVVMSAGAYEHYMGVEPTYSRYLVDTAGQSKNDLAAELKQTTDYVSWSNEAAQIRHLSSLFQRLSNTMVAIYTALSALMAVIVLLNLNIMFINEKKRELIVLMINGYSVRDAKKYISRDAIVITVIGIVLGCLLGIVMGFFTVSSAETSMMAVMKFASWKACLAGAVLAGVFSAAMTAVALRLIPRFKLTDINK